VVIKKITVQARYDIEILVDPFESRAVGTSGSGIDDSDDVREPGRALYKRNAWGCAETGFFVGPEVYRVRDRAARNTLAAPGELGSPLALFGLAADYRFAVAYLAGRAVDIGLREVVLLSQCDTG
jgi:hypothetical protein